MKEEGRREARRDWLKERIDFVGPTEAQERDMRKFREEVIRF